MEDHPLEVLRTQDKNSSRKKKNHTLLKAF